MPRGGHHGRIGLGHHHHGGGSNQWRFNREIKPEFTNGWKHNLFDCCTYPAISAEIFCGCWYCWNGKIFNVIDKPGGAYEETESSCNQACMLPCVFDFCLYGTGCAYTAQLRCGVASRSEIQENGCCSCLVATFCPCCNTNQMAYELTSRGEFPGSVCCASRPNNIPERPARPQPQMMDMSVFATNIYQQQIQMIQQQMHALQVLVHSQQNGQWTDAQTHQYYSWDAQVNQLRNQAMQEASMVAVVGEFNFLPPQPQQQQQVHYSGGNYYGNHQPQQQQQQQANPVWGIPR